MNKDIKTFSSKNINPFWQFLIAIVVFIYFEIGYLWAGAGHKAYEAYDAALYIDTLIPLVPFFIVFYMAGYVFVFLPCFLLRDKVQFFWGVAVFVFMLTVAFVLFKYLPVYMQKTYAMGNDGFSSLTRFQQKVDVSFNNCPSLHVALNLFSWLILFYRWPKVIVWLLPVPLLIICSTLLVKQHLFVDVLGGVGLACFGYVLWLVGITYWLAYARVFFFISLLCISVMLVLNYDRFVTAAEVLKSFFVQFF